jgi:restriction endonuclease S subunit
MIDRTDFIDTNYNWLGEIPSTWALKKVKHILFEVTEKTEIGDEELLSLSQYTGVEKKKDKLKDKNDNLTNAQSLIGYKKVYQNQLVSNIMLAWNGSIAVSEYDGIISPAYCTYSFRENYNPKYFEHLFKTEIYKSEFKRKSTGIIESRLRLYSDKFYNIPCFAPSLEEQNKIVDFIELKKKQIKVLKNYNSLIFGKTNPKTGFLKEYLQTLIFNAVFGKIDLTEFGNEIALEEENLALVAEEITKYGEIDNEQDN